MLLQGVLLGARLRVRVSVRVLASSFFKARVVHVVWCRGGMV